MKLRQQQKRFFRHTLTTACALGGAAGRDLVLRARVAFTALPRKRLIVLRAVIAARGGAAVGVTSPTLQRDSDGRSADIPHARRHTETRVLNGFSHCNAHMHQPEAVSFGVWVKLCRSEWTFTPDLDTALDAGVNVRKVAHSETLSLPWRFSVSQPSLQPSAPSRRVGDAAD
jgi:hypothetical protein